ncbi:hypothetical protein JSO61_009445 [Riemerella anatipestifer]|uniref:hypothetical protein n=1 Tax=Riemerella anatipestifer TaxID=34085 RepID=UPI0030C05C93
MKVFTKEELIGEWSNDVFRISLFENFKSEIYFSLTNNDYKGTFKIFENFLILKFLKNGENIDWVLRFENKKHNKIELTDISMNVGQIERLKKTYFNQVFLKKFDFERLEFVNIDEIKEKLKIISLTLNTAKDRNGYPTKFLRYWNNDERYSITIEKELVEKIKLNRNLPLEIEKTIKKANLGFYTSFEILEYSEAEYYDDNLRDVYDDYYYNTDNWLIDASGTDDPEVMNDVKWNLD